MGQCRDRTMRGTLRRIPMVLIERARGFIYDTALPIGGAAVNSLLKASSSIPVLVPHFESEKFAQANNLLIECIYQPSQ